MNCIGIFIKYGKGALNREVLAHRNAQQRTSFLEVYTTKGLIDVAERVHIITHQISTALGSLVHMAIVDVYHCMCCLAPAPK